MVTMVVMLMTTANSYSALAMCWLKPGTALRALFAFAPHNSYDIGPTLPLLDYRGENRGKGSSKAWPSLPRDGGGGRARHVSV